MSLNLLLFIEVVAISLMLGALLKFNRGQYSSDLLFVFLEDKNRNQLKVKDLENTKYHKVKTLLVFQALSIVVLFVFFTYFIINNPNENAIKFSFVLLLLFNRYVWNHYIKNSLK